MLSGNIFKESIVNLTVESKDSKMSDIKCVVCKELIDKDIHVCFGCEDEYHAKCLSDEELLTVENKFEFLCDECMKIKNNLLKKMKLLPRHEESKREGSSEVAAANESTFAVKAFEFFDKQSVMKLPEVVDTDMSWVTFYESFMSTQHKFTDHEHLVRIQDAIKNVEVMRIGGKGLFNFKTYKKCLKNVNDRLKNNMNTVSSDAKELLKHPLIKPEQYKKLISFIDQIRNFNFLAEAYKDLTYITNKMFITEIADKFPNFIKNKWIDKHFEKESQNEPVTLSHLVDVLDKELPKLELRLRNDQMMLDSDNNSNKSNKNGERFNNTNTDEDKEDDKHENIIRFDSDYCWYHRNNSHPSNRCKELWKLDGKSVSQLAKENNRCTFCGQKKHYPCPFNRNMKCIVENCRMKHHALYCFSRKAYNKDDDDNTHNTNNTNKSQNGNSDESNSKCLKSTTKNKNSDDYDSDSEVENEELKKRFNNLRSVGLFTDTFAEYTRVNEVMNPRASNFH